MRYSGRLVAAVVWCLLASCEAKAQTEFWFYNSDSVHVDVYIKATAARNWLALSMPPGRRQKVDLVSKGTFDIVVQWHKAPNLVVEYRASEIDIHQERRLSTLRDFAVPFTIPFYRERVLERHDYQWYYTVQPEVVAACMWNGATWNGKMCLLVPQVGCEPEFTHDPPKPPPPRPRIPPKPKREVGKVTR